MEFSEKIELDQLRTLVESKKEIWVKLYDGLRICLVGFSEDKNLFVGAFIPCSHNSKRYEVKFGEIREILGEKNGNCIAKTV